MQYHFLKGISMKEKEIKLKMIEILHKKEKDSVIVHEVTFGGNWYSNKNAVRADLFVLGRDISAYEIKSEHDNLSRIDKQIKTYTKFANRVCVVVAKKFVNKLNLHEDIGIYIISNGEIKLRRKPKFREIEFDKYLDYLWSIELRGILKGVPYGSGLSKKASVERLCEILSKDEIKRLVFFRLKERFQDESNTLLKLSNKSDTKTPLPKKEFKLDLKVTSLVDIPFGIIKGYKKIKN